MSLLFRSGCRLLLSSLCCLCWFCFCLCLCFWYWSCLLLFAVLSVACQLLPALCALCPCVDIACHCCSFSLCSSFLCSLRIYVRCLVLVLLFVGLVLVLSCLRLLFLDISAFFQASAILLLSGSSVSVLRIRGLHWSVAQLSSLLLFVLLLVVGCCCAIPLLLFASSASCVAVMLLVRSVGGKKRGSSQDLEGRKRGLFSFLIS